MKYFAVQVVHMSSEQDQEHEINVLKRTTDEEEIKNRLAAAEHDAKAVASHRQHGSHPNLIET